MGCVLILGQPSKNFPYEGLLNIFPSNRAKNNTCQAKNKCEKLLIEHLLKIRHYFEPE